MKIKIIAFQNHPILGHFTADFSVDGSVRDIPYYGASGIVDSVSEYIFDGSYLLVSEDGANLLARNTPIAFSITGKTWVNNHAHVLQFESATIKDLDPAAINMAREGFSRKNQSIDPSDIAAWSDVVFLNKAKITINSKITKTALVLLGKSESEHFINPACAKISWILKDKDGVEKD